MKISTIITEYNPFHLGHKYHLENCKKDTDSDGVICLMSGNFVQRGLPAITDKWSRAKMAINNGVDLVIELPTLFAISSAEYFAFGAISIIDSLKIANNVYFGSEEGDANLIMTVANILATEPDNFKNELKNNLNIGLPFPKARANALESFILKNYPDITKTSDELHKFLNSSNNILGIEYCKNIIKLNSKVKPITLKREGSNYNDLTITDNKFASATSIRAMIYEDNSLSYIKKLLPEETYNILKTKNVFPNYTEMFNYIKYILTLNPAIVNEIKDLSEGLEFKVLNEINKTYSLEDLIIACKSKRYTYTRINRALCHIYLGVTKKTYELLNKRPNYIRVLGLTQNGAKILKQIKKNSEVEIITKLPKTIDDELLKFDIKATNLYAILNSSIKHNSDYLISPYIKKD